MQATRTEETKMPRTMEDVTSTRAEHYTHRFVERPFVNGALTIEFQHRIGQNCYDAIVRQRRDRDGQYFTEDLVCRIDGVLPGGTEYRWFVESANEIANAEQ